MKCPLRTRIAAAGLVAALVSTATKPAHAADVDCDPSSGISTCIDSDSLWVAPGQTRFFGIFRAAKAAPGFGFGVATSYLSRPIVLTAASPDPEGRDINVVRDAVNVTYLWSYAAGDLELGLATPVTLHQRGAGAEGVTSQSASPIGRTAVRDPRLSLAYVLPVPAGWRNSGGFAAKADLTLSAPLGDADRYASSGGFVVAPSIVLGADMGRLHLAGDVGVRLRRTSRLATARVGSTLHSSLGISVDLLSKELLALGAEAWVQPSLVSQKTPERGAEPTLVVSEWLASLRSVPTADPAFSLQLGGGTAIPLSSDGAGPFAGVTSPEFRFVLSARYAR
jgi:hypothetical protein